MGFSMPHMIILVGGAVVGVALILQIVGLATPSWIAVDARRVKVRSGLWKLCYDDACIKFKSVPDFYKACRAFGILGVLAMAASLVCTVLICFMATNTMFPLGAMVFAAAGAFCALIEFAVYAGELGSPATDNLDYSFALTVVACVLCVVAAILFFVGKNRTAAA